MLTTYKQNNYFRVAKMLNYYKTSIYFRNNNKTHKKQLYRSYKAKADIEKTKIRKFFSLSDLKFNYLARGIYK